jgi:hypothetical protein
MRPPLSPLAALPAGGLVTLVVVGVFLMIVSIIGWAGVKFNDRAGGRYVLGVYATVLIILMIMEFSAAGALVTFTGKLDDFVPSQVKDYGIYALVNQSYADCCCDFQRCPNGTCWLPANLPYPCDSIVNFKVFLVQFIDDRLTPIAVIAILIGLVQFVTAVSACCNQCKGKAAEAQRPIGGPLSYDGYADETAEYGGSWGYEAYVKGQPRAGSAAAAGAGAAAGGAAAPRPGSAAAAGGPRPGSAAAGRPGASAARAASTRK